MDIPFDCCPYTKDEVNEAIRNLVAYFQNKNDKNYFGLDNLGIIDIYVNWPK